MKDQLRQSMPVATRLESGEVLRTEADHERAAAAAVPENTQPAAAPIADEPDTTSTPAESGTGEELNYDG